MNHLVGSERMPRGTLVLVLAVALIALAGCAEPPPPEFVSKEHKFKVQFGGEPKIAEGGAGTKRATYSVESADGARTVAVAEFAEDVPPENVSLVLKHLKDETIRNAQATEISEKSIVLAGKYPGRE